MVDIIYKVGFFRKQLDFNEGKDKSFQYPIGFKLFEN